MGPEVVAVDTGDAVDDLAVYAHCTPADAGLGVTYAVVNSSTDQERTVTTASGEATVHLLTGESLDASTILLNGDELAAAEDGTVPDLVGEEVTGAVRVPPASVAFVVDRADGSPCG